MITQIVQKLEQARGARELLKSQIQTTRREILAMKSELETAEKARVIIQEVGLKTQAQLQFHISDITSLALTAVFDSDAYELRASFVQRRNQTECDLLFVRDEQEIEPLEASGYGAVDVASFALRVVSWSMQHPRLRNTIILDEPFRFLSTNYQSAASRMIKELSTRLGLQFIIVTHEENLTEYADRIFTVTQENKISKVTSNGISG